MDPTTYGDVIYSREIIYLFNDSLDFKSPSHTHCNDIKNYIFSLYRWKTQK